MSQHNIDASLPTAKSDAHLALMFRHKGYGMLRDAASIEKDTAEVARLDLILAPLAKAIDDTYLESQNGSTPNLDE